MSPTTYESRWRKQARLQQRDCTRAKTVSQQWYDVSSDVRKPLIPMRSWMRYCFSATLSHLIEERRLCRLAKPVDCEHIYYDRDPHCSRANRLSAEGLQMANMREPLTPASSTPYTLLSSISSLSRNGSSLNERQDCAVISRQSGMVRCLHYVRLGCPVKLDVVECRHDAS